MMNPSRWALGALAGVVQIATPTAASSQTPSAAAPVDAAVYTACYVPLVGAVYRIKELGLPTACLSTKHVEFRWNQVGPKGDTGDTGETGPRGAPGQAGAAFARTACPPGSFVAAFGSFGEPICMDADGSERLSTPAPPWTATWHLSPVLRIVCGAKPSELDIQITTARTRRVSGGLSLWLIGTLDGMPASFAPLTIPDPVVPPFSVDIDHHVVQVEGQPPNADSQPFMIFLSGQFTSLTSFSLQVTAGGRLEMGGSGGTCVRSLRPGEQPVAITGTSPS